MSSPPGPESIYADPGVYDRMFPPGDHARFYALEATRHGGPVLELACGTGSLLAPIAEAGVDVAGLDLDSGMLAAAADRLSVAGLDADLHEGDMRDFDLGRRFRLVYIGRNSLLHLLTRDDLLSALRSVRRHLAADGVFVFDIFNPDVEILARPPDRRYPVGTYEDPDHGVVTVEQTAAYDASAQVNRCRWYFSSERHPDFRSASLEVRCVFPQELPLLLEAGGMRLDARYGSLERDPFTAASPQQVCECRAA